MKKKKGFCVECRQRGPTYMWKCVICFKPFASEVAALDHTRDAHEYAAHIWHEHKLSSSLSSASNSTTLDAEEGDEEQLSIVECFVCRGKFVSERALEQHSAAKHALAPSSSPSAASLSLDKEAAVGDEDNFSSERGREKREWCVWGGRERSRADSFPTYLSLDNVLFEQDDAAKVPSCDECFLQILSGDGANTRT